MKKFIGDHIKKKNIDYIAQNVKLFILDLKQNPDGSTFIRMITLIAKHPHHFPYNTFTIISSKTSLYQTVYLILEKLLHINIMFKSFNTKLVLRKYAKITTIMLLVIFILISAQKKKLLFQFYIYCCVCICSLFLNVYSEDMYLFYYISL